MVYNRPVDAMPSMTEQQMQNIVNEIRAERGQIIGSTQWLASTIGEIVKQNERIMKKKRKSGGVACVVQLEDRLSYVQLFDDQTKEMKDLTINLIPDFEVYKIRFEGIRCNEDFVGIYFKSADFYIVDVVDWCNGKRLRKAFVKNHVIFNAQISKSKVEDLLEDFFLPKIYEAKNMLTIPALAGWFNGRFLSAKTFAFRKAEGIPKLPIQTKKLQEYEENECFFESYFQEIRGITDWRNRCWIMLFPVAGMLESLLEGQGIRCDKYINFVMLTDESLSRYYRYFQVFGREKFTAQEPTEETACHLKDEVFIMNACPDGMCSQYRQGQYLNRCRGMAEKIVKGDIFTEEGRCISTPTIVFSNQTSRSRYAVNLFVDTDFLVDNQNEKTRLIEDAFGNVFFHVLKYFEQNYDEILGNIVAIKNDCPQATWFDITYDILKKFWEYFGINMEKMAEIPEAINYQKVISESLQFDDDVINDGITIIRSGMTGRTIKEKRYGEKVEEGCILYDKESVMFPTKILYEIFSEKGFSSQVCRRFLVEARTRDCLKTDNGTSLSRQIQADRKVQEVYQFKREFFVRIGLPDIIDLGMEETDA